MHYAPSKLYCAQHSEVGAHLPRHWQERGGQGEHGEEEGGGTPDITQSLGKRRGEGGEGGEHGKVGRTCNALIARILRTLRQEMGHLRIKLIKRIKRIKRIK
jgi:hypothetical protein